MTYCFFRQKLAHALFSNVVLCGFLAGCGAAVQETKAFNDAVVSVKSTSDLLWDQLSVAERKEKLIAAKASPTSKFIVDDAPYYASIGEPPSTAAFRKSLEVVQQYSQLLVYLATGAGVDAARGQIQIIAQNLATIPQLSAAPSAISALSPIINQALLAQSQFEGRQLVREGAPIVIDLIENLKQSAPTIFNTLAFEAQTTTTRSGTDSAKQIDSYRTAVSNYVVLLDRLLETYQKLIIAYDQPDNPVTLAYLAEASGQLSSDVKAVRMALITSRK